MHLIDQQLNLMIRGRFEEGWRISEQLEAMKHELPGDGPLRHMFNRGWFLLNQGRAQEGFQHLEAGRFIDVYGNGRINTNKPIWNGQDSLQGKTVLINLEAGIGDQIISARFATEIMDRGGRCIFVTHPLLYGLLQRIPGCNGCITINEISSTHHDYWIPGFSCAWLFGHDFDTLPKEPYITANQDSVEVWRNVLQHPNRKPKIGIRWSGNPQFEHQQFRKFPPQKLIDLCHLDNLQFYSLQRDTDLYELPDNIIDLQYLLISWEDTAACLANLDLVITSCTSIAHIAGAMGLPTWVIVPILPYHIWAYGGDHSPWYQNTTRVYRQTVFGEWDNVFEKLEQDLVERFRNQPETAMPNPRENSMLSSPPPDIEVPALKDINIDSNITPTPTEPKHG